MLISTYVTYKNFCFSHLFEFKKDGFSDIYFSCLIVRFKHKINIYLFLAVASQTEDSIFYQSIALKEKVAGDFNGLEKKLALQQVPFVEKNRQRKKVYNSAIDSLQNIC